MLKTEDRPTESDLCSHPEDAETHRKLQSILESESELVEVVTRVIELAFEELTSRLSETIESSHE